MTIGRHISLLCGNLFGLTRQVYDVSSFVKYHPGGREALLMAAGRDVTMIFESYHAFSSTAPRQVFACTCIESLQSMGIRYCICFFLTAGSWKSTMWEI